MKRLLHTCKYETSGCGWKIPKTGFIRLIRYKLGTGWKDWPWPGPHGGLPTMIGVCQINGTMQEHLSAPRSWKVENMWIWGFKFWLCDTGSKRLTQHKKMQKDRGSKKNLVGPRATWKSTWSGKSPLCNKIITTCTVKVLVNCFTKCKKHLMI